jgi:hypothetical protein
MRVRRVTDHTSMLVVAPAEEHSPCVNLVQMADTFLLPITRYELTQTNV